MAAIVPVTCEDIAATPPKALPSELALVSKLEKPGAVMDVSEVRAYLRNQCTTERPELAERYYEAWDSFGLANFVPDLNLHKKSDKRGVDEDLVLEEDGNHIGDVAGDNDLLKIFLTVIKPFLAQGPVALRKKHARAPMAYNPTRGAQLLREIPAWRCMLAWFHWLHGRSAPATIFLVLYFAGMLWTLSIYALFTEDETSECCKWMVSKWDEEDQTTSALQQFLGFIAITMLPFAFLFIAKLTMNTAGLPICGALVAKLEDHHAPGSTKPWEEHTAAKSAGQTVLCTTFRQLARRASKMLYGGLTLWVLVIVAMYYQYIINKYQEYGHTYSIVQCILMITVASLGFPAFISWFTTLSATCALMARNIRAYKEMLDLLCLQATLCYERELAAIKLEQPAGAKPGAADPLEAARLRVKLDLLVRSLRKQLQTREHFLIAISKATIKGEVGTLTNNAYAFLIAYYFFQLFYVGIVFINIRLGGDVTWQNFFFAVASVVFMFLGCIFLANPLVAMSAQSQEWMKVTKSLTSTSATSVSSMLSSRSDPNELHAHHVNLQDDFTWTILGQSMSYASIGKSISIYFGALWVAIILPAITDYQSELKDQIAAQLNASTLGLYGQYALGAAA